MCIYMFPALGVIIIWFGGESKYVRKGEGNVCELLFILVVPAIERRGSGRLAVYARLNVCIEGVTVCGL